MRMPREAKKNPDITTFQLFLYLGRLLHLIRQIGRERGDGQLCVGGDLEAAGEALDDAVHFWVVVQGNVFSFPEKKYHRMPMMYADKKNYLITKIPMEMSCVSVTGM